MNNKPENTKSASKQDQFMELYRSVHDGFVRYCKAKAYGIIDFEDLINESITRAFEGFNRLKNKSLFPAYLYAIARNVIKNELRSRNYQNDYQQSLVDKDLVERNHADKKFEIEILYQALSALPEDQKEALILFEISGYSIKEIAQMQDCSQDAVKQRLKRGREKLAIILGTKIKVPISKIQQASVLLTLFF
ncbi:MAG: sigma-70 family RNA polymerase sigma factor [Bacteroidales bacterium]|nr:sigma-70 family RNA polymerase sigma factor [Bacteroidales bacterium]